MALSTFFVWDFVLTALEQTSALLSGPIDLLDPMAIPCKRGGGTDACTFMKKDHNSASNHVKTPTTNLWSLLNSTQKRRKSATDLPMGCPVSTVLSFLKHEALDLAERLYAKEPKKTKK